MPDTLNRAVLDEILPVENEDAFAAGRELARREGVLAGISSGAALYAATVLAKRAGKPGQDDRRPAFPIPATDYLSTPLFSD